MKHSQPQSGLFIDGAWCPAGSTFQSVAPHDQRTVADVANATIADTQNAIAAAHRAFSTWSQTSYAERAGLLLRAADIWEARKADYVALQHKECGSTLAKAYYEAANVSEIFRTAAAMCYAPTGHILPSKLGKHSTAVRVPIGPITVISPWNFSGILTARGFAFALAAGNTIVLKPSEETPITGGVFFAEVMQAAGTPEGVFNLITCDRNGVAQIGDLLVNDPRIAGVSFTGSTNVGRQIASRCGHMLKKCCLELGGKDNLIIRQDADMDRALNAATFGAFFHQGQICMSVERILVHVSLYQEFLAKFKERTAKITYGDPTVATNAIGPLINAQQVRRIQAQLDDAIAKGATLETGGTTEGNYFAPTILTGVTREMEIYGDETFGPVVPVLKFSDDAQAVELANDTAFGLSAGIISADEEAALAVAAQLKTGMCHINDSSVNDEPHVPFGGSKDSGVGRHGGQWSMETFTETRWITCERGGRQYPPGF
ncbi:aldehyde dehydrogenase family protein [Cognatishimia sp. WU-CL00825]|uniref:aldehyde dehydrogenase family protein n=1 Tax=Cognatishimia sp. WU-CL00825 TaxID=3127658 RepID=UPI003365303F